MADVQFWGDTIISEIEEIRAISSSIPNQTDDLDRTAAIDDAEKKIRNAKGNCRSLKAEIRIVADPDESNRYRSQLASYEQTLSQLSSDIQGFKSDQSRNRLFLGADTNGFNGTDQADPVNAGDALLDGADNIQDKTKQSLQNTTAMIAESKATGMMTLEELDRQKNQINAVDENVMRMEDNLNRADTLIKAFGKRMATDKLIQGFACINILLIVGVVIYSIVKGGLPGEDQEVPPESPVGGGDSQTVATTAATRMLRGYY